MDVEVDLIFWLEGVPTSSTDESGQQVLRKLEDQDVEQEEEDQFVEMVRKSTKLWRHKPGRPERQKRVFDHPETRGLILSGDSFGEVRLELGSSAKSVCRIN